MKRPISHLFFFAPVLSLASLIGCAASPAGNLPVNAPSSSRGDPIQWLHGDWTAALAKAKEENKPLVVDVWAPWCHTCLSMQHYVLSDPSMAFFGDRFVWLALDTDKPEAASFLEKFPVRAWPTFFVVSPADESIQARFQGAATLAQFKELLKQGELGHLDASLKKGELEETDPLFFVRKGDRAALAGRLDEADAAYAKALEMADPKWSRRPDVLVSRISVLAEAERWSDCANLGLKSGAQTGTGASATDFTYFATLCASKLDGSDPRRTELYELAVERLTKISNDPEAPLSVDDRSDALLVLRGVLEANGDKEAAKSVALKQLSLLDEAAEAAPDPKAASTYNWPRAEVYVYLGRGQEIIDALKNSTDALPEEYDPPYRLAWVALQTGDLETAATAAERALGLAYGPRKGNVLELLAGIYKAAGYREKEKAALQAAVELYEALPRGQERPQALVRAREALDEQR